MYDQQQIAGQVPTYGNPSFLPGASLRPTVTAPGDRQRRPWRTQTRRHACSALRLCQVPIEFEAHGQSCPEKARAWREEKTSSRAAEDDFIRSAWSDICCIRLTNLSCSARGGT